MSGFVNLFNFKSEKSKKKFAKNYKLIYLAGGVIGIFMLERALFHNKYVEYMKTDEKANFIYFVCTLVFFIFCGLYILMTIFGRTVSQDWAGDKLKLTKLTKRTDLGD